MLRFLADHNFNGRILQGLSDRTTEADVVRAHDVGLASADDRTLLAWAAENGRIVFSQDVNTLVGFAYQRVAAGQPMPGVLEVPQTMPIGRAVEDLVLIAECGRPEEFDLQVRFLPL
jgi:hypothetical protein